MTGRVLVLGAAGFVGRALVTQIAAAQGAGAVVAGIRRPDPRFAGAGIDCRLLDAADEASVDAAASDATHIVNCVMGSAETMTAATRSAIAVAERRELRLVHFGSIAVFGDAEGTFGDDAKPIDGGNGYATAKAESERMVLAAVSRGLDAVVLRPALIYGPGSTAWTLRIADLLRSGRLGDLGAAGEGLCNLVHVRDVAAAAIGALEPAVQAGTTFNLAAPRPRSWNRYLEDFADALGVPFRPISRRRLSIEKLLAYPLRAAGIAAAKVGRRVPEPITPSLSRLFGQRIRFEGAGAARLLDGCWTDYHEGLAESAAWVRGQRA